MIVQIRVDARLIHGQIVLGWIKELETTHILVVDDAAATSDRVTYSMLHMAVQAAGGQKLVVKTLKDSISLINDSRMDSLRVFLITRYMTDAWEIVRQCPGKVQTVNCANFGYHSEEIPEKERVSVEGELCSREDVACMNHLVSMAQLEVFRQITPDSIALGGEGEENTAFRRGYRKEMLADILKRNGLYQPE